MGGLQEGNNCKMEAVGMFQEWKKSEAKGDWDSRGLTDQVRNSVFLQRWTTGNHGRAFEQEMT